MLPKVLRHAPQHKKTAGAFRPLERGFMVSILRDSWHTKSAVSLSVSRNRLDAMKYAIRIKVLLNEEWIHAIY
jgi:hypothetical protein